MAIAKYIVFSLLGFGGGIVISGAVFAFIAIIGVVPRLAQKSHTEKYIKLYEEAIIWGGILGASCLSFDFYFLFFGHIITLLFLVLILNQCYIFL